MSEWMICPEAGTCTACQAYPEHGRHDRPHKKRELCNHAVNGCLSPCIPYIPKPSPTTICSGGKIGDVSGNKIAWRE